MTNHPFVRCLVRILLLVKPGQVSHDLVFNAHTHLCLPRWSKHHFSKAGQTASYCAPSFGMICLATAVAKGISTTPQLNHHHPSVVNNHIRDVLCFPFYCPSLRFLFGNSKQGKLLPSRAPPPHSQLIWVCLLVHRLMRCIPDSEMIFSGGSSVDVLPLRSEVLLWGVRQQPHSPLLGRMMILHAH